MTSVRPWVCSGACGTKHLSRSIFPVVAMIVLGTQPVGADHVTVDLEYRTDTLVWELYALVVDTGSGNGGDNGLAALRGLIDNIDFGTNGEAVNLASGIGAIDPIAQGEPNERPAVLLTSGGTLDIIYGQDISDAPSVVGGVGVGSRALILDGTFPSADTPPAFGDDDRGFRTDGNFLNVPAPGPFGSALPGDGVTLNVLDITPGGGVGDYNNNNQVEQGDLDLVLLNWGAPWPPNVDGWVNDQPTDGKIDQDDLDGVLLQWGNTAVTASASTVPEPASLGMFTMGMVGCLFLRWRSGISKRVLFVS